MLSKMNQSIQPVLKSVQCLSPAGLHKMVYKEWGNPDNPKVLVCVHGLARVSDDFDNMARALCDVYRVVCPDVVGRGRSGWLRNSQFYQVPQYVSDMVTLLARLNAETVHWFGTSMGGLIGMGMASLNDSPIRKLVLNDVGPRVNPIAIARIRDYIGQPVRFPGFEEAVQYIKMLSQSFGLHTDEEWRKFAADVLRQDKDGNWTLHYDPAISVPIKALTPESIQQAEAMAWVAYDAISCPTLLVRGMESDLTSIETAREMAARGPKAKVAELLGVGHAPTFVHADQIAIARNFLLE
jgi:pimeloyl-ACP methyl ester carboxylesterase